MPLHAIKITVSGKEESTYISDVLFELGALSVSRSELKRPGVPEQPIFGEPPMDGLMGSSKPSIWEHSEITALYPLSTDIEATVMLLGTHFNLSELPTFSMQTEVFDEKSPEEWIRHVQKSMEPIELDGLRISFPWHEERSDVIDLRLEPGMAFGTGEHQTTQLCLQWLQRVIEPGSRQSLLDYGTGSGVLSVAAMLFAGDASAVGVDIDPDVIRVAHDNAELNGVGNRVDFCECKDEPQDRVYDIVVANILAGPLMRLADLLAKRMKKGAKIAMAGLLASQGPQIIEQYAARGVALHDAEVKDGWLLVVGTKE